MPIKTGRIMIGALIVSLFGTLVVACYEPVQVIAAVTLSPASLQLDVGDSAVITAIAFDSSGKRVAKADFAWRSSNSTVAEVNQVGLVRARAAGFAKIFAVLDDTINSVAVEVFAAPDTSAPQDQLIANRLVDGFESKLKDATDPTGINEGGFKWISGNGTPFSIVRDDGCVVLTTSQSVVENCGFLDLQWENGPDGTPGRHAARFRYPASSSGFGEQRFFLGGDYPEVWIRYWLRVPINYRHVNVRGGATNNKFFTLWIDGYSTAGQGGQGLWEYRPQAGSDTASGASVLHYKHKTGGFVVMGGDQLPYTEFIRWPQDRGRWMQVVYHMKVPSSPGVADGQMEMWRRWEGDSAYTLIHARSDLVFDLPPGYAGFRNGYILGASNSGFAEVTEFLMDRFEVSTTRPVPLP